MTKYGPIKNAADLNELQNQCGNECTAVGFTADRNMFAIQSFAAKQINDEDAKAFLGVNDEQLALLKETGGTYKLDELKDVQEVEDEPAVEDLPLTEASPEQKEIVEEVDEEEIEVVDDPPVKPTVKVSEERLNELLEAEEHAEYLQDEVTRLKKALDEKIDEHETLVRSIQLIKSI